MHFENMYLQNMQPQNLIAILAELLSATLIIPPVACTYQYYAVFPQIIFFVEVGV